MRGIRSGKRRFAPLPGIFPRPAARRQRHNIGVGGAMVKGINSLRDRLVVSVDQHVDAQFFCAPVTKCNHFTKFPAGVDMQKWEGRLFRVESLQGQMKHHRRILSNRVKHHRAFALSGYLTKNIDRLSFQLI